jgi:hypothetical protein
MDLSRGRTVWLVAGAVCALVFVVGTSVSPVEPGYVLEDGDLGVLAGSAALTALAVFRIRAGERRADSALATHGATFPKDRPDRRASIGGRCRAMVVLFPHVPGRKRPYAVPAFAKTIRSGAR